MKHAEPQIIELPKIVDPRGNLSFLQFPDQVPFEIKRVFWTYDVEGGEVRGGHAFKRQSEMVIALSGSFDVVVKDAKGDEQRFLLNRSYYGLLLPPMTWRHMQNFSTNAVSFHLTDAAFSEQDYIRDLETFNAMRSNG